MSEEPNRGPLVAPTTWWDAQAPFAYGLTQEGALTVQWSYAPIPGGPQLRFGIVLPAEEVKILRQALQVLGTTQETLTAKRPAQGAH